MLMEKQIEPFLQDIYSKLESLSREDLIKHFVSSEFNRFLDYYKIVEILKVIIEATEIQRLERSGRRSKDLKPVR